MAGLSSTFFGVIFNIQKENLAFAALGGAIAVFVYDSGLTHLRAGIYVSTFFAAATLAIYAEIVARIRKTTVSTFVISSLIPLVPGAGMYYTMLAVVQGDMDKAAQMGAETLGVAGLLAFGIIFSVSIFKFIVPRKRPQ